MIKDPCKPLTSCLLTRPPPLNDPTTTPELGRLLLPLSWAAFHFYSRPPPAAPSSPPCISNLIYQNWFLFFQSFPKFLPIQKFQAF